MFVVIGSRVLRVIEKNTDVVSSAAQSSSDSGDVADCTSDTSAATSYRLTEQFVIKVQKVNDPAVRFYSCFICRFIVEFVNDVVFL